MSVKYPRIIIVHECKMSVIIWVTILYDLQHGDFAHPAKTEKESNHMLHMLILYIMQSYLQHYKYMLKTAYCD